MPSAAVTMAGRCTRVSLRQIDALLTSLMLPVVLMLMFVYLFGGAIETGTKYVTYVVPGVILLCAGFGSATTAVNVSQDMTRGIVDRFRSMDIGGPVLLAGHVAASIVRNAASTVLVFAVALAIGFRPSAGPLDWLAVAGVLLAFMLAISWLAAAIGLLARSPEAATGFAFLGMFLPYASSAFDRGVEPAVPPAHGLTARGRMRACGALRRSPSSPPPLQPAVAVEASPHARPRRSRLRRRRARSSPSCVVAGTSSPSATRPPTSRCPTPRASTRTARTSATSAARDSVKRQRSAERYERSASPWALDSCRRSGRK